MTRAISLVLLRLVGWQPEGRKPTARRFVLIAAPHTSNWDLPLLLALASFYGVRVHWMGKHALFRGPMGWLMRKLGGVPVRRDRRNRLVVQMAELIASRDAIALTVPAEGTRGYVSHWKSGFYHIARTAGVPIVMGYLDYGRRRGGFGPELVPTASLAADMDEIRAFYADKRGRHPENAGAIRLAEEA